MVICIVLISCSDESSTLLSLVSTCVCVKKLEAADLVFKLYILSVELPTSEK